jgi:hypothetical protein
MLTAFQKKQKESFLRKLVANARAIISNQIGMPLGVQKMDKIIYWIENLDPLEVDFSVFSKYYKKVGSAPIGTERLLWNFEALKKEDIRLDKINAAFKDEILEKCFEIIRVYGQSMD